ncbi:MAG: hypothetical protein JWR12_3199 [Mucilaginibacter sp.]|nr:hypothetical protein [Mucilaginibacter sp.]
MAKIFITGITGFLGSNIADFLSKEGHHIVATYREKSSKNLCLNYYDKVHWVLQDENNDWVNTIINTSPDVIIHSAWMGVSHNERDDWECQFQNINFIKKILFVAKHSKASRFICLGSQAEYGPFDGVINEEYPLNPVEAYGCVKIICSELVKQYCTYHKIDWYWLRLFSFFGSGESENWLIPSLVKKIILSDYMDLTLGEQKYAYLYVGDLGLAINSIILKHGQPGIYNISGKMLVTLKNLVEGIRNKINPSFKLNFGKLPYRLNQSMHMQGDSSKFIKEFDEFEASDFESSMLKTIECLKEKFKAQVNEGI